MKKTTFLTCCLFLTAMYSQALTRIANRFEGSKLCESLSITYGIPDTLIGNYSVDVVIDRNIDNDTMTFNYYLTTFLSGPTTTEITTDINSYFSLEESYMGPFFAVKTIENLFINEKLINSDTLDGFPFFDCQETISECGSIKISRKMLEAICPTYDRYTDTEYSVNDDSISFAFNDSIVQREVTCLAFGFSTRTDIIEIKKLDKKLYSLYQKKANNTSLCWPTPCSTSYYYEKYKEIDFRNCIINHIDDDQTSNSYIHPNPAQNSIFINDLNGKVIFINELGQQFIISGNERFDTSNLPSGIYVTLFQIKGEIKRERIIIQ